MNKVNNRELNRIRSDAVRNAWKREALLVEHGSGTYQWSVDQQKELLETGRVEGYVGHHMKSCSLYPEYAGEIDNIQFLTVEDHLAAHNSSEFAMGYQSYTNGWYDAQEGVMYEFLGDDKPTPNIMPLNECYIEQNEIIEEESDISLHEMKEQDMMFELQNDEGMNQ